MYTTDHIIVLRVYRPISLTVAKCWDPDPIVPTFEPRCKWEGPCGTLLPVSNVSLNLPYDSRVTLLQWSPSDPSTRLPGSCRLTSTKVSWNCDGGVASWLSWKQEYGEYADFSCCCCCIGEYGYGRPFTGSPTLSTMTSNSSPSLNSSNPETECEYYLMSHFYKWLTF